MTQRNQRLLILVGVILAIAIYINLPNSPGVHIGQINKDFVTRLGLDLVGGVQALLEADLPEAAQIDSEMMRNATSIVENRVNGLGVAEAVVQQAGDRRIVVELPGEIDPEKALATIRKTGRLVFVDFSHLDMTQIFELIESQATIITDDGLTPEEALALQETFSLTNTETTTNTIPLVARQVFHTVMGGEELKTIQVQTDPKSGEYVIAFELKSKGAEVFRDFTSQHVGDVLAIVLDKKVISAPTINQPITDGRGLISGNFTYETANELAVQLRYGSLPIPLKIVEVRTVGPTLGQDSLRKSLIAGAIGFIIVILFMTLYYRLPGVVADIAIVFYALLAFAIFRFIPVTLTLPGVAGFLLSTGSALDANILIFERLKEELRSGRNLLQAYELAFKRAWPSIRDSNIATLITSGILFWFGSTFGATIVKGFSVTLALGVVVSLFTALVATRSILGLVLVKWRSTDFAKWFGI